MVRVLIKFSHGLGDVVQAGIILKHLRKYRPDWEITFRCGRGKHTAVTGLCHKVEHDQQEHPDESKFNTVLDILFYENYCRFTDRPNTKVTNCLHEVFGLSWDKDIGSYSVNIGTEAMNRACIYLTSIGCKIASATRSNAVILHYEGNTSTKKKNLLHWQAKEICERIIASGRVPVLLDWDGRSQLPDQKTIFCPKVGTDDIWGGFGSGDAETIAALIEQSEAYIGIDSGPGKIASATTTPTLICWMGHHPIQFHDLATNTVHLVPSDHRKIPPACDDPKIADWFEANYTFRTYDNETDLVTQTGKWLAEVLGNPPMKENIVTKKYVTPAGIGDTIWALLKIRSIHDSEEPIDILLSGDPSRHVDHRAIPFLKRFDFIRSVEVTDVQVLVDKDNAPTDALGRYRYVADGIRGNHYFLIPNAALEQGKRIEEWLPEYPVDWDIMNHFSWKDTERGTEVGKALSPFVAFYLGPESGTCDEGHNYGWLWEPKDWITLGKAMQDRGLNVAVIGADYDRSYWEKYVKDGVEEAGLHWIDLIGKFEIGETFSFLKEAKAVISYQCGLAIVSHYLGLNVCSWWRPDGLSGHPVRKVCFHNNMRSSFIRPGWEDRWYGALYKHELPGDLIAEMDRRGWIR